MWLEREWSKYQNWITNLSTAPLLKGRSRLVPVAPPFILKSKGVLPDPFWAAAPRFVRPIRPVRGRQRDSLLLPLLMHLIGHKASGDLPTRFYSLSSPSAMCRKRSHASDDEVGQPSSSPKRFEYHIDVAPIAPARRRAIKKPKDNPLIALWCFICTATSNEGLLLLAT